MQNIVPTEFDEYMNSAQSAMFHHQMIEQALKTYIFRAHEIVQFGLPPELGFTYREAEYDSMPLERLLNVFSKFTHNKPLLEKLNGLRQSRNHLAHRSFALAFLGSFTANVDFTMELSKVKEASAKSLVALMALKDELTAIAELAVRLKEPRSCA